MAQCTQSSAGCVSFWRSYYLHHKVCGSCSLPLVTPLTLAPSPPLTSLRTPCTSPHHSPLQSKSETHVAGQRVVSVFYHLARLFELAREPSPTSTTLVLIGKLHTTVPPLHCLPSILFLATALDGYKRAEPESLVLSPSQGCYPKRAL